MTLNLELPELEDELKKLDDQPGDESEKPESQPESDAEDTESEKATDSESEQDGSQESDKSQPDASSDKEQPDAGDEPADASSDQGDSQSDADADLANEELTKIRAKQEETDRELQELKQQRDKEAQERAAEITGAEQEVDESIQLSPRQFAEQEIRRLHKEGHKFTDNLEVMTKFEEFKEKHQQKLSEHATKVQTQTKSAIINRLNSLGVKNEQQQQEVSRLLVDWARKGTQISIDSLDIAVEHLKATGKLTAQQDPSVSKKQTTESKSKEVEQKQQKKQTNKKITRSTSTSSTSDDEAKRKRLASYRDKNLEEVVGDLSQDF